MKKFLVFLSLAIVGCSSTPDDLSRYEEICIEKMGICPADDKKMNTCIKELRKIEGQGAMVENFNENFTEYQITAPSISYTAPRMAVKKSRKGCVDTTYNGMPAERCACGGKEPVICYEQMVNKKRIRRCEAEGLLLNR